MHSEEMLTLISNICLLNFCKEFFSIYIVNTLNLERLLVLSKKTLTYPTRMTDFQIWGSFVLLSIY